MAEMIAKLIDASIHGNVSALHDLLKIDPLILDRQITYGYTETPLHISTMRGHVNFTKEILERQPEMAAERSIPQKSTPLHLAATKGYVEIVKLLLMVNSEMCYATDKSGRNPLHIAGVRGRIDVLKELVRARPLAARAVVQGGDTILHLCVKYDQFDALKVVVENCIVENMEDEFVNSKNDDGNTILHLAVADRQTEMIEYIISHTKVAVNATNSKGYTSLDMLSESRRDHVMNDIVISDSLQLVGGRRERDVSLPGQEFQQIITWESNQNSEPNQLRDVQFLNSMMVVASLLAAMSFQAATNPPSGVWQENNEGQDITAGTSIMATNYPAEFKLFQYFNTTCFMASIAVIALILIDTLKGKHLPLVPIVFMVLALSTSALTYCISNSVLPPHYASDQGLQKNKFYFVFGSLMILAMWYHVYTLRSVQLTRAPQTNSSYTSKRALTETV